MKDKKQVLILFTVALILGFSGHNLINDKHEMQQHEMFFKEMLEFKNKGGRNTSDMGRELCDRINILAFHLKEDMELTDCDVIYE